MGAVIGQKKVDSTIVVVVQETCARIEGYSRAAGRRTDSFSPNPRLLRYVKKLHRNLRWNFLRICGRIFGERILPLLSVGQAHRRAKLVLGDVLEASQALAGLG